MKTKKIFALFGLCFLLCGKMYAQIVSQETARKVAERFFLSLTSSSSIEAINVFPSDNREQPTMFAFSLHDRWVLISGDKRLQPILAYSDENAGVFPSTEDMPDGMLYMLEWYNEQIVATRNGISERDINPQWEMYLNGNERNFSNRSVVVGPLLIRAGEENAWKQGWNNGNAAYDTTKYYNKFCPILPDCPHRAVVGCVALALGQVMWYWKWPYAAIIDIGNGSVIHNYDWDAMPVKLYDSTSIYKVDMTAIMLRDCGVSVHMNYGCNASRTSSERLISALRDIFGYNADNLIYRRNYPDSAWLNLMKGDLNALRPILYSGSSTEDAHQFVIDGYDSENLFHINYGWGGSQNGFFAISNISYNAYQSMIIGIYPNYPSCSPMVISSSDIWESPFLIQNGGAIIIGNRIVREGMQGAIFTNESVTLASGFEVELGAEVYIDIMDMNCDNERAHSPITPSEQNSSSRMPEKETTYSPATKILRDGQILILRGENIYDICGRQIQ